MDKKNALRAKAEKLVEYPEALNDMNSDEFKYLLHELKVHRIELELQNEELRDTQQELQKSLDRYYELYNNAPTAYVIMDKSGIIIRVNDTFYKLINDDSQNVKGLTFADFIHHEDMQVFRSRFRSFFQNPEKKQIELRLKRKDEQPIYVNMSAVIGKRGHDDAAKEHLLVTLNDITDRVLADQQVARINERYDLAMDATGDGLWDWNLVNNEVYFSPNWKAMLGYEDHEIQNKFSEWERLTHPDDVKRSWKVLEKHISGDLDRFDVTFKMKHKDGHWVYVNARASASRDSRGKAVRVVGTHNDVSRQVEKENERLRLEKKLFELQKSESLKNMAGGIAHNFNNLLMSTQINIDYAIENIDMDRNELMQILKNVSTASRKASEIGQNMLIYLGQKQVELGKVDIFEMLPKIIESLIKKHDRKIKYTQDIHDKAKEIMSNEEVLRQIFFHILENGVEAQLGDRNIDVKLSSQIVHADKIPSKHRYPMYFIPTEDEYLVYHFKDRGTGIKETNLDKIFDPFYTEKFTGRGLGLSIVYGNVKILNGCISVESEENRGSTFSVYLPLVGQ